MSLWTLTLALALFFVSASPAAAEVCPPQTAMSIRPTQDVAALQKKLKENLSHAENYFAAACRLDQGSKEKPIPAPVREQILNSLAHPPETQFMQTLVPLMDKAGNKTQEFLQKVLDRVRVRHKQAQETAAAIETCTQSSASQTSESCKDVTAWLKGPFQDMIQLTRFNLALANPSPVLSMFEGKTELELNSSLNTRKSAKALPWKPMDENERQVAAQSFAGLEKLAHEAANSRSAGLSPKQRDEIYREELLKIRHVYHTIYLGLLGINPIFQNIQSAHPSAEEIHKASQITLQNLKKENKFLDQRQSLLKKKFTVNEKTVSPDREILDLMNYHSEVEEVLLENPQYCGMAVSLTQLQSNRETENNLILGMSVLPLMVASVPLSFFEGVALSSIGSAYIYYDADKKYKTDLARETARVQREGYTDFTQVIGPDPETGKARTVDQLRMALQKDVTQLYRSNLQNLNQSDSDRTDAAVSGVLLPALPVAGKQIGSYLRSFPKLFINPK